ncbi:VOC family protein [Paenibacillus filicis]|uniref:VOC family protein n=1 Tax=Paenibacillus filicis TaxID=669464 RepID=A0ABU9DCI9_9BACL
MQKITPFLWFDGQAEEAMQFYVSIFSNSRILNVVRSGAGGLGPEGSVMTGTFELEGQQFMALNGGPHFTFSPAISFFVSCETQEELDELWEKLVQGGEPQRCGWLRDPYGISWQIIPAILGELLHSPDAVRSGRVMQAMLGMDKLDIAALQRAYQGE